MLLVSKPADINSRYVILNCPGYDCVKSCGQCSETQGSSTVLLSLVTLPRRQIFVNVVDGTCECLGVYRGGFRGVVSGRLGAVEAVQ